MKGWIRHFVKWHTPFNPKENIGEIIHREIRCRFIEHISPPLTGRCANQNINTPLPASTKHLYTTKNLKHDNIYTTSNQRSTLVQHCINVIQMFRFYWERSLDHVQFQRRRNEFPCVRLWEQRRFLERHLPNAGPQCDQECQLITTLFSRPVITWLQRWSILGGSVDLSGIDLRGFQRVIGRRASHIQGFLIYSLHEQGLLLIIIHIQWSILYKHVHVLCMYRDRFWLST